MTRTIVRYEPGSSGRFCASIIQSLISEHKDKVDPYGGMHNQNSLPNVAQSHNLIEHIIDQYDIIVQVIIDQKDLPLVCTHFYNACIKRWWDTSLLKRYHPDIDKEDLLKTLMQKTIPNKTLNAMINHHSQYEYTFTKYPSEKIIPIDLDCLLNQDPVKELLKTFPTDKDLSELNSMVVDYQHKHKKIYIKPQ